MKKTILTVVAIATMNMIQAQEKVSKITFGAKAGLNLSNASVDRTFDTDISSLIGVHVGGFANFKFNENLHYNQSFCFLHKGIKSI